MLQGTVTSTFALSGRGTVVTLEIAEGLVKAGDSVRFEVGARVLEATVRSAEFVDYEVGRPGHRAEAAILVDGLEPSAVPPGTRISSL